MKIALAQLNYHIGNFEDNARKIIEAIQKAEQQQAELVVFSELAVTGYYPHDLLERKEFIEQAEQTIEKIASACTNIAALVGAPSINTDSDGKQLFNSAFFLKDGQVQAIRHKSLLPTYDIFDEYRHFEPNKQFELIELNGKKLAVTICEDLWDEQPTHNVFGKNKLYTCSPFEELSKLKPDLMINLSASPFSHNQANWRKNVLVNKAIHYQLPIVYVNQIGAQTEIVFDGGSCFLKADGSIPVELAYFQEDFQIIDTDNPEVQTQAQTDYIAKIHEALVLGIRDYFQKSGFKDAVLGLSGGIDSALVCALAVDALGKEHVRGILMPSKYSSDHSVADAVQLAENLGIQYDTVPIQNMVNEFEKQLAPLFENTPSGVAEENIQARTRGTLVMAVSNKFGHILLNTTNKSECAVGYGTLYGDMNGGLAVLGDVYKTDVYKLSHYINREQEIIPINSIQKPPSAELRPDQKDTDSLPDYDILDDILFNYIELNKSPQEIIEKGFEQETVNKIIKMVNRNEYKRFQAPPILRVSSKAFGFGRKMPLVAKYD
ncbi:NAD+ synthase [Sunxiuqinia elliptica]|uniref:Glutamine-dependent NAD(+) synthetase n=1 Tax=Sunxiuqinia elliptica TaxID=655355 RepID=A0A4R6H3H9_9BACT|nr:NAD+ synthase [Sunxiuqinia elliptica]TDO02612.1 NAD+ synthase (glutamine-hydrolysing) [Sunxiuqinia elliptica]TDO58650.1 NAD+ synthase (glutamine-hydrolysing) [Sunxiuqinia elliptica]